MYTPAIPLKSHRSNDVPVAMSVTAHILILGSLEQWLISNLGQGKYKVSLRLFYYARKQGNVQKLMGL